MYLGALGLLLTVIKERDSFSSLLPPILVLIRELVSGLLVQGDI